MSESQCGNCQKKIPANLQIISCDTCKFLFHVKCCNVNHKEFKALTLAGKSWTCNKCTQLQTKTQEGIKAKCGGCKKQSQSIKLLLNVLNANGSITHLAHNSVLLNSADPVIGHALNVVMTSPSLRLTTKAFILQCRENIYRLEIIFNFLLVSLLKPT